MTDTEKLKELSRIYHEASEAKGYAHIDPKTCSETAKAFDEVVADRVEKELLSSVGSKAIRDNG